MCLSPIKIKDPNYKLGYKMLIGDEHKHWQHLRTNTDKYGIHQGPYMYVPCGHCSQCIAIAQMEMVQRIQMEALNSTIYMGTLTYRNETLPRITTSQGYEYRYAQHRDATNMIRRLRDNNAFGIPFKYLIVSERGSKRARPHFHILLLFKNDDIGPTRMDKWSFENTYKWTLFNEWKRKISGTTRDAKYTNLCEYRESKQGRRIRRTYDFHWVDPRKTDSGITDAAFYVLKYMLKSSTHEEKIRQALMLNYWDAENFEIYEQSEAYMLWNTIKSKKEFSLGFGLGIDFSKQGHCRKITEQICDEDILSYLKGCISDSKKQNTEYAYYYCPENLSTFPLANYYKKYGWIYSDEDEEYFYNINPQRYEARYLIPENLTRDQLNKQISDFNRIVKFQEMEDIADGFDDLFK